MTRATLPLIAALALAGSTIAMPPAMAQTATPGQNAPAAAQDFTQEELRAYAVAALEIQRIGQTYAPQVQAAEPAEQPAVQEQAYQEMASAIQDEGLTVDKYNQIAEAAQSDPQVAEQVRSYIEQQ